MKSKTLKKVLPLALLHFLIDFECTALLTLNLVNQAKDTSFIILCTVIYNGLAFAFQFVFGAIADQLNLTKEFTTVGTILVIIGIFINNPLALSIVIGVGNGLFHIGASRDTLINSNDKASYVGIFVSPGVIGIFLGPVLSTNFILIKIISPFIMLLFAIYIFIRKSETKEIFNTNFSDRKVDFSAILIVVLMFITVLLRQYIGGVLQYDFKSDFILALIFSICMFIGKFSGGILCDKFNTTVLCIITQSLALIFLLLSVKFSFFAFIGILLFNTTMPITAMTLFRLFPKYPGATFGLTTLALYIGALPSLLKINIFSFDYLSILILGSLSALSLIFGLIIFNKRKEKN